MKALAGYKSANLANQLPDSKYEDEEMTQLLI